MARRTFKQITDGIFGPLPAGEVIGPREGAFRDRLERAIDRGLVDFAVDRGPAWPKASREDIASELMRSLEGPITRTVVSGPPPASGRPKISVRELVDA